jgi:hypothetical protein
MGNTTSTGHVLAVAAVGSVGFEKTLREVLRLHQIQPWSAKDLIEAKLQRQLALAQVSPLRYIPVSQGLRHYQRYLGNWVSSLTRETFVQASIELFATKGMRCPLEESKILYDVFDSLDLYQNVTLSLGEFCGGLSNFFAGDVNERTAAIFDVFSQQQEYSYAGRGELTRFSLRSFLQPYVWCMVPSDADILRPLLLDHVTGELFFDMACDGIARTATSINFPQMQHWMTNACRTAAHSNLCRSEADVAHRANVAHAIANEVAVIIDMSMQRAWTHHDEEKQLMAYSKQSWAESHGNQQQLLVDVGAARWASQRIRESSQRLDSLPKAPTLLTSFPHKSIAQMKEHIDDIIDSYWGESEDEDDNEEEAKTVRHVSL